MGDPSDAPAPSYAPVSPASQRPPSRSRSLSRRPSQGALGTPVRPTGLSSSSAAVPPTPALPNPRTTEQLLSAATTSPHYTTSLRSRHSLYGTEDRVVLDLGSRVWKVGFSGEPAPREGGSVLKALAKEGRVPRGEDDDRIWGLERSEPSEEEWEVREERVKRMLRQMWFDNLMVDPKTRKVIVVENPLLSTAVKDMIARIPSLSFASAPLLSLMAAGAVTGLVVDVGHLETTVLPVFHSRPLFPLLTSTPRAGARLNRRLRTLLLQHAAYVPPPPSLTALPASQPTRIPRDLLTEELVEEIKTRMCFVGEEIAEPLPAAAGEAAGVARAGREASVVTTSSAMSLDAPTPSTAATASDDPDAALLEHLTSRYSSSSSATTVSFRVPNLSHPPTATGIGRGWIQVPGWVREGAAEVLWEEGDQDELGLAGVVLECLMKLPTDLKKPLASSILVTGGTAMLPGFFTRFKASLLSQLRISHPPSPPPSPPLPSSSSSAADEPPSSPALTTTSTPEELNAKKRRRSALSLRLHTLRHSPRYAPLVPLAPHLAILNHPSPSSSSLPPSSTLAREREGSAPAFAPALQAWVGGSLAGALKTGGLEVTREMWDEMNLRRRRAEGGEGEEDEYEEEERELGGRGRVPDWSWAKAA
ncbi:hypothetical protein JCM10213v2_007255 [Rhodosporidiobolus nylandii]